MQDEIDSIKDSHTWDLVSLPSNVQPLGCRWVFTVKLKADGQLEKLKARLFAKKFLQEEGVDYIETYNPVIKTATVRLVLHTTTVQKWDIRQLDVNKAFLHGDLDETVYMKQPKGFIDHEHPDYVCCLSKALYGLKQAPRAWFNKFSDFLLEYGFTCCKSDASLFLYQRNLDVILLLLYVDDMLVTGNNSVFITTFIATLSTPFKIKDLGQLHYFLGIQATFDTMGLFLCQKKYVEDLLLAAAMFECAPVPTPLHLKYNQQLFQTSLYSDPTRFRSLTGKLQYFTLTRPNLQFAVNVLCKKMHSPTDSDYQLLKRILRYIKGTLSMGITFSVDTDFTSRVYCDSDWAGCHETRRSTGGFYTFLGSNIILWSAKRQPIVLYRGRISNFVTNGC